MNEELWEVCEKTLPRGFRLVGVVDRPDGTTYDLGQNAESKFALFRRCTDPFSLNSHYDKPERLSEEDLIGFGLLRSVCYEPGDIEDSGEYSSLCKTHLLVPQGV